MRQALLAVVLLSSAALGEGIDGLGRISLGGGYRWVPNWHFIYKANQAGTPFVEGINGGPQATASFGLGVSSVIELSIDLLGSFETFKLALIDGGTEEYTSAMYGAQLGGRLTGTDVFFKGFAPYLSLQAGPLLSNVSSKSLPNYEKVLLALSASVGATYRFSPRYGIALDARYMLARATVPPISGINVGGFLFSAMFVLYFPSAPKRDLDVPGF